MSRRRWLVRGLLVVVLAVVANVLLSLLSRRHDVVLVSLAVACGVLALVLVVDATATSGRIDWSVERLADTRPVRTEATLGSYERLLERHWASREVDTALQRRLLALAQRRLAQSTGPDGPDVTPAALGDRLGPELAALTDPVPRRLDPTEIGRLVDRIEEL
jgi:hypothetical protein